MLIVNTQLYPPFFQNNQELVLGVKRDKNFDSVSTPLKSIIPEEFTSTSTPMIKIPVQKTNDNSSNPKPKKIK